MPKPAKDALLTKQRELGSLEPAQANGHSREKPNGIDGTV
jgi:hypothetical protein